MSQHIILVAFEVSSDLDVTREQAEEYLRRQIKQRVPLGPGPKSHAFTSTTYVESWWVAEDDRNDGSDLDSAVFVRPGAQHAAHALLMDAGLTYSWNEPRPGPHRFEAPEECSVCGRNDVVGYRADEPRCSRHIDDDHADYSPEQAERLARLMGGE